LPTLSWLCSIVCWVAHCCQRHTASTVLHNLQACGINALDPLMMKLSFYGPPVVHLYTYCATHATHVRPVSTRCHDHTDVVYELSGSSYNAIICSSYHRLEMLWAHIADAHICFPRCWQTWSCLMATPILTMRAQRFGTTDNIAARLCLAK
jgi:hypothetical protein